MAPWSTAVSQTMSHLIVSNKQYLHLFYRPLELRCSGLPDRGMRLARLPTPVVGASPTFPRTAWALSGACGLCLQLLSELLDKIFLHVGSVSLFAEAPDQAISLHRCRVPANPPLEPALSIRYGMGRFPYRVVIHAGCTLESLARASEAQHGPDAWSTKSHSGLLLFCYVMRLHDTWRPCLVTQGGASWSIRLFARPRFLSSSHA